MRLLSLLPSLFVFAFLYTPIDASERELYPGTQPISINLGIETIVATYAYSLNNLTTIGGGTVPDYFDELEVYGRSMSYLRGLFLKDYEEKLEWRRRNSRKIPILSSLAHQTSHMKTIISDGVRSLVESYELKWVVNFMLGFTTVQKHLNNLFDTVWPSFQLSSTSDTETGFSDDYLKSGFFNASQFLKNMSRKEYRIDIQRVWMVVPRFIMMSEHVQRLIREAAKEVNIDIVDFELQEGFIQSFSETLDEEIPETFRPQGGKNLLIIDYGTWHFDVRTESDRCNMMLAFDDLGCAAVPIRLFQDLVSSNEVLKKHVEQGASEWELVGALAEARFNIKKQNKAPASPKEKDHYEEWPLMLEGWWIGEEEEEEEEEEEVFLHWEDVEAAESGYVDIISDILDEALHCMQGRENERGVHPIDRVVILGNTCERPLIKAAVNRSVGESTKISGGNSQRDIALAAQPGARFAFRMHEMEEMFRKDYERTQRRYRDEL